MMNDQPACEDYSAPGMLAWEGNIYVPPMPDEHIVSVVKIAAVDRELQFQRDAGRYGIPRVMLPAYPTLTDEAKRRLLEDARLTRSTAEFIEVAERHLEILEGDYPEQIRQIIEAKRVMSQDWKYEHRSDAWISGRNLEYRVDRSTYRRLVSAAQRYLDKFRAAKRA